LGIGLGHGEPQPHESGFVDGALSKLPALPVVLPPHTLFDDDDDGGVWPHCPILLAFSWFIADTPLALKALPAELAEILRPEPITELLED
jgi:hypothetical protein